MVIGNRDERAGAPEIARSSGGDSLNISDAYAVEQTFERIRKRYAVYFQLPVGMESGRGMALDLTDASRRRHPDASLQYRQVTLAKDGARPGLISRTAAHPPTGRDPEPENPQDPADNSAATPRRRQGVSDSTGTLVTTPAPAPAAGSTEAPPPTTSHRRGVSDPGSGGKIVIAQ